MDRLELRAEPRSVLGKKVRFLRRQGTLPANIYGHGDSTAIQLPTRETERVIARAGRTNLIALNLNGGEPTTVLVRATQRHPTRGDLLHVDFFRVAMTERMKMDVPVRLVGDAPAVKQHDGVVFQTAATVTIESLPGELPDAIEVDISGLEELDSSIHVSELRAPGGVTILTDPTEMVVKVMPPTVGVEEEAAPEAAAVAEGEQPTATEESAAE